MTQRRSFQSVSSSLIQWTPQRVGAACLIGGASLLVHSAAIAQTAADLDPGLELDYSTEVQEVPSANDLLDSVPMPSERPVSEAPQPIYSNTPDVMFEDNGADVSAPMSVDDLMQSPPSLASGSDIDSANDYNLGATYAPDQVGSVVLSERSTGCQTTLERGQDLASLCAPTANSSGQSVNLGPVSVGPDGVSLNPIPSFDSFYNVTTRPISQPSNGDRHLLFPLSIPAPITSLFGWRQHPIFGDARFHAGIDLGAPMGAPVVAAFSGQVVTAEFLQGYGLTVVLMHNNGTQETLYAHLSEIFVKPGDTVAQGDVVGRVGSTGNSTGPHLHFEVRELENGTWVTLNPAGSLQVALNNFVNGFDGLQVAQTWSKTGLQAGLARSEKHHEIWMPLAVQVGMFAPVPQKPDLIPPEQMERVVVSKSIPGSEAMVSSDRPELASELVVSDRSEER